MFTKQTITRKSIDALSKVCPGVTLPATAQSTLYGGARYYSPSSGSLGSYGTSDEMRVIASIPQEAMESGTWPDWKLNKLPGSTSISVANASVKSSIIRFVASENGYYNVSGEPIDDRLVWGQYRYTDDGSIDEVVVNTHFLSTYSGLADLKVVMYHEMVHRDQRRNTLITGNVSGPDGNFKNDEAEAFYKAWKYAEQIGASGGVVAEMKKRYEQEQF